MMSAIASIIEAKDPDEIERVFDDLVDPAGYLYRYSLPKSMLRKKYHEKNYH
jgi:hypothetical protein